MSFCAEVRKRTEIYWEGSFEHPFVKGIADGSLPLEKFRMYTMQDAFYLKHYTKVLAFAASKADRNEDVYYSLETSGSIHEAELDIHLSVCNELGVTEQEIGATLKEAKPGVKLIAMYSSNQMEKNISVQLKLMNRFAEEHPEKVPIYKSNFKKSCYYEWKFREMAWSIENWKEEVNHYEFV